MKNALERILGPLGATCAWSPDETLIQLNHSGEEQEK
jgi:hypothetical protein